MRDLDWSEIAERIRKHNDNKALAAMKFIYCKHCKNPFTHNEESIMKAKNHYGGGLPKREPRVPQVCENCYQRIKDQYPWF